MSFVWLVMTAWAGPLDIQSAPDVEAWLGQVTARCVAQNPLDEAAGYRVRLDVTRGRLKDLQMQAMGITGEGLPALGAPGQCVANKLRGTAWAPTSGRYEGTVTAGDGDVSVEISADGVSFSGGGGSVRIDVSLPGQPAPTPAAPAPVPETVGPARLVLRNPEGEWAEIRLDGKVIAEFSNETELVRTIDGGQHTLAVHAFMEDEPFYEGRLDTRGADEIILGIDVEKKRVRAYNHDGLSP